MLLNILFLVSPCVSSASLDAGATSPCSGILISKETAKKALTCCEALKVYKANPCKPCPPCSPCPVPEKVNTTSWFLGGALVGTVASAILGALLVLLV